MYTRFPNEMAIGLKSKIALNALFSVHSKKICKCGFSDCLIVVRDKLSNVSNNWYSVITEFVVKRAPVHMDGGEGRGLGEMMF